MPFCKNCGNELKDNKCSGCGAENNKTGCFLPGCLFVIVILVMLYVIGSTSDSGNTNTSSSTEYIPALEVVKYYSCNSEYSAYVCGVVQNNSDKNYSYAQVSINLYDTKGVQIGSTFDNTNNLEAHGKWKFKALCNVDENQFKYKIMGVTGY